MNLTAVAASCFLLLFSVSGLVTGTTGLYLLPRLIFDLSSRGGGLRVSLKVRDVSSGLFVFFFSSSSFLRLVPFYP